MLEWLGCEYRKRPQAPGRSLQDHSFKMLSGTGVWNLMEGRHPQQRSPSTTCWHPHDRSLWAQWEWIRPRACGWNPLGSEREKEIIVSGEGLNDPAKGSSLRGWCKSSLWGLAALWRSERAGTPAVHRGVLTTFSLLIASSLLAALGLRLRMTRFNMIDLLHKRRSGCNYPERLEITKMDEMCENDPKTH